MKIEEFWNEFLKKEKLPLDTKYYEAFSFGTDGASADELLKLTLEGKRTATSCPLSTFKIEGRELPGRGSYSIILDSKGEPRCIIQTKRVVIMPLDFLDYDHAKLEGTDDDINSWKKNRLKFFEQEGKRLGYDIYDSMEIVFEIFDVVYKR